MDIFFENLLTNNFEIQGKRSDIEAIVQNFTYKLDIFRKIYDTFNRGVFKL